MKTAARLVLAIMAFLALSCLAQAGEGFSVNGKLTEKSVNEQAKADKENEKNNAKPQAEKQKAKGNSIEKYFKKHAKGELVTRLEKLWYEEIPLSELRSHVPYKTTSTIPFYIAIGAALLLFLMHKFGTDGESTFILLPICSLAQSFYILTYDGNPLWFFDKDQYGWLATILTWCAMVVNFKCLREIFSRDISEMTSSSEYPHSRFGIACWGWTIFFAFLQLQSGLWSDCDWVLWFFLGSQLLQIVFWGNNLLIQEGSPGTFAFVSVYYLVVSASILLYLYMFICAAPTVSTIFVLLMFTLSGPIEPCCGNCRTYRRGYCYFKKCYVDSESYCESHQY